MSENIKKNATRFVHDDRGHGLVMFGLTILPAVMLVGGAIDFGSAYKAKSRVQAATDAGVLAAIGMPQGTTPQARQAMAVSVFNANTAEITGLTAAASYENHTVTMQATGSVPTSFLRIAHIDTLSIGGSSKARVRNTFSSTQTTDTERVTAKVCLLSLDPTAATAFIGQGTPNVDYTGCWAHANSNVTNTIAGGGSGTVVGDGHSSVGAYTPTSSSVYSPLPVGGAAVVADPFATVSAYQLPYSSYQSTFTAPSIPSTCKANGLVLRTGTFELEPGRYCGGLTVMANATVTFKPGEYIIQNGQLNFQSGAKVTGEDILFYLTGSAAGFQVQGKGNGGKVSLKGRTSGPDDLKGFVIIAHPNAYRGLTSNIQGGVDFNVEGMIYAPTQNVLITGDGEANQDSNMFGIVAKSFEFRGNGIFRLKPWTTASTLPNIMPAKTFDAIQTFAITE